MQSSDSSRGDPHSALGAFYLDPLTTHLDEAEFRIDLYEYNDSYVLEAERKNANINHIYIEINEHSCTVRLNLDEQEKIRNIWFPINLFFRCADVKMYEDLFEIHFHKQYEKGSIGPYSLWLVNIINKGESDL